MNFLGVETADHLVLCHYAKDHLYGLAKYLDGELNVIAVGCPTTRYCHDGALRRFDRSAYDWPMTRPPDVVVKVGDVVRCSHDGLSELGILHGLGCFRGRVKWRIQCAALTAYGFVVVDPKDVVKSEMPPPPPAIEPPPINGFFD